MSQIFSLRILEDKSEQFWPLFLRDEDFAKLANDIGDILLDNIHWFGDESLEQQILALCLVSL